MGAIESFFTEPQFTEFFVLIVTLFFSALGWYLRGQIEQEELKILQEEHRQTEEDLENAEH